MCPERLPREILLRPGTYVIAEKLETLRTLLGSCVAVTFWHPGRQVGAMCHYLLARRFTPKQSAQDARYAEDVIPVIHDRFRARGLAPGDVEVRMFGGSNMFPDLCLDECLSIGSRNVHEGRLILESCGFRILSENLSGTAHRMVVFETGSGRVYVRQGRGAMMESGIRPREERP